MNYQHMSALLTRDCTAIASSRLLCVAVYIDVLVVIKLSDGISWDDSSRSYEIVTLFRPFQRFQYTTRIFKT